MQNKSEFRTELKRLRQAMPAGERAAKSQAICKKLEQLDWSDVKTLHCFEPVEKLNEVNTQPFIKFIQKHQKQIEIHVPRLASGEWLLFSIDDKQQTTPVHFDAIIVPVLGFDPKSLHRIGYGGGYYDKFLATQSQAKKIGVCFDAGKLDHLVPEPHDIPLDIIVTETS